MLAPAGRLDVSSAARTRAAASPVNREGSPVLRAGRTRPVQGGATVRRLGSCPATPPRRSAPRGGGVAVIVVVACFALECRARRVRPGGDEAGKTMRNRSRRRSSPSDARALRRYPHRAGPAPNRRGVREPRRGRKVYGVGAGMGRSADPAVPTSTPSWGPSRRGAARAALRPKGEPFARRPCRMDACLGRGSGSGVLGWGGGARGPPGDLTLSLTRYARLSLPLKGGG